MLLNSGLMLALSFLVEDDDPCVLRNDTGGCVAVNPDPSDLPNMLRLGSIAMAGAAAVTAGIFFPAICSGSGGEEDDAAVQLTPDRLQVEWSLSSFRLRF